MQIIRARVPIPYLLVGLGVCVSIFGPSIKSNVAPKQFNPTVRSEVSKLEIIQTAMLGPNVLQVIMKNGYAKDITAVVACIGIIKLLAQIISMPSWSNDKSSPRAPLIIFIRYRFQRG